MRMTQRSIGSSAALVVSLFAGVELMALYWVWVATERTVIPVFTREVVWFAGQGVGLQTLLMSGNVLLLVLLWLFYRASGARRSPAPFLFAALALALAQGLCWWLSGGSRWVLSVVGAG